jgi:hypothetical protein
LFLFFSFLYFLSTSFLITSSYIKSNFNYSTSDLPYVYSAVGTATGYRLDNRGVGGRVPLEAIFFSFPQRSDRFWAHPTSYPVDVGRWSWPLISNKCWGQEYMQLYLSFPIRLHGIVLN